MDRSLKDPGADEQRLRHGQTLREDWEIEFEAGKPGAPMIARLKHWPNSTYYLVRGYGETIERARADLLLKLAAAIHEDPDPFGNLGRVAHVAQVYKFLKALNQDEHTPENPDDRYEPASDYFLPHQLGPDEKLPDNWQDVIDLVVNLFSSWADYFPEEENDVDDPSPLDDTGRVEG
jgi:hypothetical protein